MALHVSELNVVGALFADVAAVGVARRALEALMRSRNQRSLHRSLQLSDRARSMLHAPTPSEAAPWAALRALGVVFERQVPDQRQLDLQTDDN